MISKYTIPTNEHIEVPEDVVLKWQQILDLLSDIAQVPAALIMKVHPPSIEVFASSRSEGNPYKKGENADLPGLYCETVLKSDNQLLIPNAEKDVKWKDNPDIKLGMISYLGLPLKWPDGKFFGTICMLDSKENAYNEKITKLLDTFRQLIEFHLDLLERAHLQNMEMKDLEKMQKIFVERELKMVEMKRRIKDLENKNH